LLVDGRRHGATQLLVDAECLELGADAVEVQRLIVRVIVISVNLIAVLLDATNIIGVVRHRIIRAVRLVVIETGDWVRGDVGCSMVVVIVVIIWLWNICVNRDSPN